MLNLTTSTLVLSRLFAQSEGGYMASTPKTMRDLAERLALPVDVAGQDNITVSKSGRWTFMTTPEVIGYIADLRCIPELLLRRDASILRDVLHRVVAFGAKTNALRPEELEYLVETVMDTGWASGLAVIGRSEEAG